MSSTVSVFGLDVGGANLKVAHSSDAARLRSFPLWKNPAGLAAALRDLLSEFPTVDTLAVTMTGELCDCFETKRQGVNAILDAVAAVAGSSPVLVWQTTGRFVDIRAARQAPLLAAAANWQALATYAGRFVPTGPGVLIDIGSTTADIIPVRDGEPIALGRTDPERLRHRELIYTGVRRTPICALLGSAVAAELFATTLDAYLVLGLLPEDADDRSTADGRPATKPAAHARLARMLCADSETCSTEETTALAQRVYDVQRRLLRGGIDHVIEAHFPGHSVSVVLSGSGEFLGRSVLELPPPIGTRQIVSLTQRLGADGSAAACAYAVAVLAAEEREKGR